METLELFVRFAAVGILLTHIGLIASSDRPPIALRYYGLLAAGLVGFLLTHASVALDLPLWVFLPLSILSKTTALFIWWFIFALFVDGFKLGRVEYIVSAIWILLLPFDFAVIVALSPALVSFAQSARILMAVALAAYVLGRLLADRTLDLVESRRTARIWVAAIILGIYIVDLISDAVMGFGAPELTYSLIQKTGIAVFAAVMMRLSTQTDISALLFQRPPEKTGAVTIDADQVPLKRLEQALAEKIYRDPTLTIRGLAKTLALSEYRLRALINERLGYRNFRTFLNDHRLEDAKQALASPEEIGRSITDIALDSGFASLASFNRVFKDRVGEPPSQYRGRFLKF